MKTKPFFTIGIPIYNTEKWIGDCLDSVLVQKFTDFEIICVDDGSTDASLDILSSYAQKDNRIKIVSRPNGGPAAARNSILASAEGEYILFLDSDDKMNTCALQHSYFALAEANFPDVMECGFVNIMYGVTSEYKPVYPGDEYFSLQLTKDERAVKLCVDKKYLPSVPAKLIRRKLLQDSGIVFNPRYTMGEDADFMFRIHRVANNIAYSDVCTFVRIFPREGSIMSTLSEKSLYSYLSFETEMYRDSQYLNIRPEYRKMLWDRLVFVLQEKRDYILTLLSGNVKKSDMLSMAQMLEGFLTPYLKYMAAPQSLKDKTICALYRLIGIRPTVSLLYDYLKFKGIITDE